MRITDSLARLTVQQTRQPRWRPLLLHRDVILSEEGEQDAQVAEIR
jgi:hypothetical protein